jgi:hypothetical protein
MFTITAVVARVFLEDLEQTLGNPVGDTNTPLPMVELRLQGPVRS